MARLGLNSGRLIFLMRHGEPVFPNIKKGKQYIGQTDLPLSKTGILQAQRAARGLKWANLNEIFASDLSRTVSTAEIMSSFHNIKPKICPELREISLGDWEGRYFSEIKEEYPEAFMRRGEDLEWFIPPNGESFHMLSDRVVPKFYELIDSTEGNIMLVTHSGVCRCIICNILNIPLSSQFKFRQDYCCINVIRIQKEKILAELINYTYNNKLV
jgi:alpha-ribazole phosphatase